MATVTKPIALDESINTTEQTPRNIADVLAEELARIAENILPPNAEDIAYDNTESGLTATNVQDAIDEVISSQADVIADTMADLTENKTATVTDGVADFETIDGSLVKSLVVEIEPVQNLNGYSKPWVGGAGKNKLGAFPATNPSTSAGVTYSIDDDGIVTVNGTSTGTSVMQVVTHHWLPLVAGEQYTITCDNSKLTIDFFGTNSDGDSDWVNIATSITTSRTFTLSTAYSYYRFNIRCGSGVTFSNEKVHLMLRLASETDPTYEPYENICPISGHTQEDVTVVGKNLFGFEETAIDATATYRPSASQRLTLSKINDNAVHCVYADGRYSRGYFELDGIDGTVTYSISYTVENNTTSYTPEIRVDADNSDATKLVLIVSGGNNTESVSSSESFDLYNIQLELGNTATTFEPYHGKTYTTPFNQTVYGGTLDVLTGELTITHGYVDLGSLTWARSSTRDSSKYRFNASHTPLPKPTATNADVPNLYSSNYTAISPSDSYQNVTGVTIATNGAIYVYDESLSTATGAVFKTAMNGVQLVYELETPTVIQLTPQKVKSLVGENHISASTGDVLECKYSKLINGDDLAQIMGG